jgi:DNA-directed RNA polymerase subunit M/transcription elongation factor TFIIS
LIANHPRVSYAKGQTMGITKELVTVYVCERCEHRWIPRDWENKDQGLPLVCARCKSPYWNRPKKAQASENPKPAPKKAAKKRAKKT